MKRSTKLISFLAILIALVAGTVWMNQTNTKKQFVDYIQASSSSTSSEDKSSSQSPNTTDVPSRPLRGYRAPDFTLTDLSGKTVKLSDLKGKKVFINFWASWCPPCKAEMPELVSMSNKYKDKVEFYGINLTASDSVEGAKEFVSNYKIEFPTLLDKDGAVAQQYQVIAIPTSITVDANGMILDRSQGQLTAAGMEDMIKTLIGR